MLVAASTRPASKDTLEARQGCTARSHRSVAPQLPCRRLLQAATVLRYLRRPGTCTHGGRSAPPGNRLRPICSDRTNNSRLQQPETDPPTPSDESQSSLLLPLQFSIRPAQIVGLELCRGNEVPSLGSAESDSANRASQKQVAIQ